MGYSDFGYHIGFSLYPIKGFHIFKHKVFNWKGQETVYLVMYFYSVFWLENSVSVEG